MGLTFHELVLPEEYAPKPSGGPSFSHSVFSVPGSGVEDINRNRPSALHRYSIPFHLLTSELRSRLYSFFLAVGGIGGGFRMLAPEPHNRSFDYELLGTGDGETTFFYLKKTHTFTAESWYGGGVSTYTQRIVKPVYGQVQLYKADAPVDLNADGDMDWTTGAFEFDTAPTEGQQVRASGQYHLPVRFTSDWLSMAHDITSEGDIEVVELAPKSIGIAA